MANGVHKSGAALVVMHTLYRLCLEPKRLTGCMLRIIFIV